MRIDSTYIEVYELLISHGVVCQPKEFDRSKIMKTPLILVAALLLVAATASPSVAQDATSPATNPLPRCFKTATLSTNLPTQLLPTGPWTLEASDVDMPEILLQRFLNQNNTPSFYMWSHFSDASRITLSAMAAKNSGHDGGSEAEAISKALNEIITGNSIYVPEVFHSVALSGDTLQLLATTKPGAPSPRLNRLLIEDALPGYLVRRPKVITNSTGELIAFLNFRENSVTLCDKNGSEIWTGHTGIYDATFTKTNLIVREGWFFRGSVGFDLETGRFRHLPSP